MALDQLAQLGGFIGRIFVLVSIVYLAHLGRQNTQSLRTEELRPRVIRTHQMAPAILARWHGFVSGDGLMPVVATGRGAPERAGAEGG